MDSLAFKKDNRKKKEREVGVYAISLLSRKILLPFEKIGKNIKELLVKQISSTVKWRETILKMREEGVKNFVEIGPGKVLTGMVKRTVKDAIGFSINSIADIKNIKNEFRK